MCAGWQSWGAETHAAGVGGGHAPGANETRGVPSALAVPVREHLQHLRYHKRRHRCDARPAQASHVRSETFLRSFR